ncbi:MAG: ABC transporter ATP-binding protein [Thermodesulfobacteriota bacterium]|nr:ABC transporter ATP-binding protein [Thermodesulfobacteriota bacterium]
MTLVRAEDVSKTYISGEVEVQALREVSFEIEPASFVSIVGPSGSGKTTLLNLIGCLDKPTAGDLVVAGKHVNALDRKERAAFRGEVLGFIFQSFNLISVLTAYENVEYPLAMVKNEPKPIRKAMVLKVLEAVGMLEQKDKRPDHLSGGQKQRVAVARALVARPKLVLADEPTANLDQNTAINVVRLMRSMRDEFGTTFIFSTHDPRIMGEAEMIHTLQDGRLVLTQRGSDRRKTNDEHV